MRTGHRWALAAILLFAAFFLFTMTKSILRRAETTYNYPAYSSLNNGTEGTKAYFEALHKLGYQPSRNYQPLHKVESTQADLFYFGPALGSFRYSEARELEEFERLAQHGARVIIVFDPDSILRTPALPVKPKNSSKSEQAPEDILKKRWGIELAFTKRNIGKRANEFFSEMNSVPVTWRFSSWANGWTASEIQNGIPLFLERRFGGGSILLISDSKLFTNRELLLHPNAALLAHAAGGRREIVFDESHLGLEDTGTVVGLAGTHGLAWMIIGFVVLAILYVWHSSVSFVPPLPSRPDSAISGHDAYATLSNLLLQSIPKKSILRVSAEEWNRTCSKGPPTSRTICQYELDSLEHVPPVKAVAEYKSLARRANLKLKGQIQESQ